MHNHIYPPKDRIDVEELNKRALKAPLAFLTECEKNFLYKIEETAGDIASSPSAHEIILMTGPSASGKTTSSGMLAQALERRGIKTVTVSLDNFYRPKAEFPVLPDGSYDFDAPECLDLEGIHECFRRLLRDGKADVPVFNFAQERVTGFSKIFADPGNMVIFEGIHALNPLLTGPNHDGFYKIYLSARTDFWLEDEILLPARSLRLIRRSVRDYHHRGSGLLNTLSMWRNVCESEEKHIKSFMNESDRMIDSVHEYEPMIYLPFLSEILGKSEWRKSGYHDEIINLTRALGKFIQIEEKFVPKNSLIREFLA